MANFELKVGKFGIKYGADLPIVKDEAVKSAYYSVGNSPLDLLNTQLYSNTISDYFLINSNKNIIRAINECPQVSTILFRKGQQIANGITTVKKANGKPAVSEDAKRIQKLIDRPNVFQNRAQYVAILEMYLNSWGWIAEYKETVAGFGVVSRRLLKPENCQITWKRATMFFVSDKSSLIESFKYTENGIQTTITDFENIYFYTAPNFQAFNNGYLPESPLKTLENPINSSIKNYKSRIRSVGAPWGFLSRQANDKISDIPMKESEKKEFLENYENNYGVENNQSTVAFANAPIQFNAVMPPVASLQLLELLKSDSAVICDVLGYEFDLLGRDLGGVAHNNKNEAGKNQYQNHTIPAGKNRDEQEMESLGLEDLSLVIETDFSHVPCMQEDLKAKSEELRNNVQSLIQGFKNNLFNYDDMVIRAGVSDANTKWAGKWWFDFTPEEQALFQSQNTNTNGNNQTQDQANQGANPQDNGGQSQSN